MKYLLIASLWASYCALHSYLISIRFTNLMTYLLGKYYSFYRLAYAVVSLVLLIPLINYTAGINDEVIIHYGNLLSVALSILRRGSLLMFFWVFLFDYDALSFFGIRQMLNFWKTKELIPPGEIKKSGLLGLMRHPMYFAFIIFLWCQTFRMMDIVVNTVLTIYIIIGTRLEENKLAQEFGEAYVQYQKEVPMLIPFTKMKVHINQGG